MAGNGRLTRRQDRAILALLSEPTIGQAARAARVGERTLFRWLKDSEFKAAYQAARREAVFQAIARLQQIATKAVDALEAVVTDRQVPAASRVAAAKTVLESTFKAQETEDFEQRLKALEEAIGEPRNPFKASRSLDGSLWAYD